MLWLMARNFTISTSKFHRKNRKSLISTKGVGHNYDFVIAEFFNIIFLFADAAAESGDESADFGGG